jgi:hypothetical protein
MFLVYTGASTSAGVLLEMFNFCDPDNDREHDHVSMGEGVPGPNDFAMRPRRRRVPSDYDSVPKGAISTLLSFQSIKPDLATFWQALWPSDDDMRAIFDGIGQ